MPFIRATTNSTAENMIAMIGNAITDLKNALGRCFEKAWVESSGMAMIVII